MELNLGVANMERHTAAGRRTGKTTTMLNLVKDGDRIVVPTMREFDRFRKLCNDRGLFKVQIVYLAATDRSLEDIDKVRGDYRKTFFDHFWLEEYYLWKAKLAYGNVRFIKMRLQGYFDGD